MMQLDGLRKGLSLVRNNKRELSPVKNIGREVFSALETERAQVAESLQEDISQLISIAKMRLSGETAGEVNTYLAVALNKLRLLTFEMKPLALEKFGLAHALKDLLQQRQKVTVNFANINLHDIPDGIDSLMEAAIFRLVQQILNHVCTPAYQNFGLEITRIDDYICLKTKFKVNNQTNDSFEAAAFRNNLVKSVQTTIYLFNGHYSYYQHSDGRIDFSICLNEH